MIESSIARRYSRALLQIGKETGEMDLFLNQLVLFEAVCKENPNVLDMLSNRFVDVKARLAVIDELTSKLDLCKTINHFLKLLVRKGRIGLCHFIVEAYRRDVYKAQGKIQATIISADKLSQEFYDQIEKILSQITGLTVLSKPRVDPDVLGGVAVEVGGQVFDGTVQSGLSRLSDQMMKVAVN
jgi:F-type H+-transporting ATPase subunit delta